MDRDWQLLAKRSKRNPSNMTEPEHLAYCIYTSGSTGKPKGVLIEQKSLLNHTISFSALSCLSNKDNVLQFHSIAFDAAVEEIIPTLTCGGSLTIATDNLLSPSAISKITRDKEITILNLSTSYWEHVVTSSAINTISNSDSLRLIIIGGEPAHLNIYHKFKDRLKNISIYNTFGPTECCITNTYYDIASSDKQYARGKNNTNGVVPIGRPIANTSLYILDEHMQPVPIGVPGELHIGGAGLARGYLNRPELTAEKFISNPFGKGRLYKSGDLARYLEDGNIEYLGRIDNQVKVRGFRIELGEIEMALMSSPDVQEAVVTVREDTPGDTRLIAYVVPHEITQDFTTQHLRSALHTTLPEYMLPNVFMVLETLPLTPNGKIDRKALPEPDLQRPELTGKYVAPGTATEEQLVELWQEILHVDQVGIYDNFFELGGHSLLATQLVSRIRQFFTVELPLRSLFELTTVAEQAAFINEKQNSDTEQILPPIELVNRTQSLSLSYAQQRLWLLDKIEHNSAFYNVAVAYKYNGILNKSILEKALNHITQRHEILRTYFEEDEKGTPIQVIAKKIILSIPIIDLSESKIQEQEISNEVLKESVLSFNLKKGPLLRCKLIRLDNNKYAFILVFTSYHHRRLVN